MDLRQAELTRDGGIHMVTWIPAELCKKGAALVDRSGRRWTVLIAYSLVLEREDMNTGWRVGGLT